SLPASSSVFPCVPNRTHAIARTDECARLRRVAQAREERVDALVQGIGLLAELAGGGRDVVGQRARLVGRLAGAGDVDGDLGGAGGGLLHAAGDFARRRVLLFDGGGDRGGDAADFADGVADAADRRHAIAGRRLNRSDLACDLFGRLRGLVGEFL